MLDFPSSPANGAIFQNWTWDAATGAWKPATPAIQKIGAFIADRNGTNQTGLGSAGNAKITWINVASNADGWFNVANGRYTPQLAGTYFFVLSAAANIGTGGESGQALLYKNTAQVKSGVYMATGGMTQSQVVAALTMNGSTDFVEAYCYIPAASTILNGNPFATHFQGWRVGA
jgi:hypothetical protein